MILSTYWYLILFWGRDVLILSVSVHGISIFKKNIICTLLFMQRSNNIRASSGWGSFCVISITTNDLRIKGRAWIFVSMHMQSVFEDAMWKELVRIFPNECSCRHDLYLCPKSTPSPSNRIKSTDFFIKRFVRPLVRQPNHLRVNYSQ